MASIKWRIEDRKSTRLSSDLIGSVLNIIPAANKNN